MWFFCEDVVVVVVVVVFVEFVDVGMIFVGVFEFFLWCKCFFVFVEIVFVVGDIEVYCYFVLCIV